MRINAVQTTLFRKLRELNILPQAGNPAPLAMANDGTDSPLPSGHTRPGLFTKIRLLRLALNEWLASCYRLCHRPGLVSSVVESRTILLHPQEVVRLKPECRTKTLVVRQGTMWLKSSPTQGDVLLRTGDRFNLNDNTPFVVDGAPKK